MSFRCIRTSHPDPGFGADLVYLAAVTTAMRIDAASPSYHGLLWARGRQGRSARAAGGKGAKYLIAELVGAILQAVIKMRDSKR